MNKKEREQDISSHINYPGKKSLENLAFFSLLNFFGNLCIQQRKTVTR